MKRGRAEVKCVGWKNLRRPAEERSKGVKEEKSCGFRQRPEINVLGEFGCRQSESRQARGGLK